MSALAGRFPFRSRLRLPHVGITSGISAIIVKELRGRMRGRRAFIVLTIHVALLAVFAWMFERISEEAVTMQGMFGGTATFASASIGRAVFFGLMMLQTLMVAVLAPAATAGAISSEREHQTLELLAVTPISSLAIVLGKLLSALAWVFVLILASIPVTSIVFVFGGVALDDMIRGYIVLFATVIGFGSIGIFFSTLTRRTGASTGLTFVITLVLVVGSVFLWGFLLATAQESPTGLRKQPSEALLYLNPFVAQADVACGTEEGGFGNSCSLMSGIIGSTGQDIQPPDAFPGRPVPMPGVGIGGGGVIVDDFGNPVVGKDVILNGNAVGGAAEADVVAAAAEPWRDRFWPKSVLSFLILATVMTLASVQFVTPTRRWRPSLPGPVRRLIRRRST